MKQFFKILLVTLLSFVLLLGVYIALCRHWAAQKVKPAPLLFAALDVATPQDAYLPDDFLFYHQANTPKKIAGKEKRYNNFEFDIYGEADGSVSVAHDESDLKNKIKLQDIFAALAAPSRHNYWLDVKSPLSAQNIATIKTFAAQYNIEQKRLIFEPNSDEQAQMLKNEGFNILLFVHGFGAELSKDQLAALAAQTEQRVALLRPMAISANISQYPFLKTYFPNCRKAIYYTNTKRPSLKKRFLRRFLKADPAVAIYLEEAY